MSENKSGPGGSTNTTKDSGADPKSPSLIKKSAPTRHLPIRDPGSGVGGSVPTQHLPSKPSQGGGGGQTSDGGNSKD